MNLRVERVKTSEVIRAHKFSATKIVHTLFNLPVHVVGTVVSRSEDKRILRLYIVRASAA